MAPPVDSRRIDAAMVAALYRAVGVGVGGAAVASVLLAAGMARQHTVPVSHAVAWSAAVIASAGSHMLLAWRRGRDNAADRRFRRWEWAFVVVALIEGALWGWGSVMLPGAGGRDLHYLTMVLTYAIAGGAVAAFGASMPAFLAFFLPATLPFLLHALADPAMMAQNAGVLAVLYCAAIPALAWRFNTDLRRTLWLSLEREALAGQLANEKAAAERANLSKSQFLAAASHDLRQPVHALSLFVGALQSHRLDPAARHLVEQIDESVTALDGLFGALLDISRLDAGAVPVTPAALALGPLLDRVCRQWRPEAAARRLGLRAVATTRHVWSDAAMLERLLGNLVGNAVRHTVAGRVLVGCRTAPGGRVRIEVWDTGPGICEADRARIWDEYVQLANPERDRGQGLGLGLAIVRRVAALLEADVTLRSWPGAGSCFAVTLPMAAAPPATVAPVPGRTMDGAGRLLLVIDDEAAVRAAAVAVLEGWGYRVIAAASLTAMRDATAVLPVRPALVLCDFRLADGDGITAIRALQDDYNGDLPGLLVTGDTAPDRLQQARRSGLPLLHKPVSPRALRAALRSLLGPE